MLCAKCHRNEATVHLTVLMDGKEEETVHLCEDCAPPSIGLNTLDRQGLEALSITGKKCEFCGQPAHSGVMNQGGAVYLCLDCKLEYELILADLAMAEPPGLMQRATEAVSFLSICADPEVRAWSEAANQKAVKILKERRGQDGRDEP